MQNYSTIFFCFTFVSICEPWNGLVPCDIIYCNILCTLRNGGRNMPNSNGGKVIQSVQRAIDIINCFDDNHTELTLTQISQILDLNKSTVHGILNTMHNNGYICQNSEGRYLLGQVLLNKSRYSHNTNKTLLTTTAKPYMVKLSSKYKVTSNLFIMHEGKPMVLHQVLPANSVYTISHVSDIDPLYCIASGKLALANMSENALNDYLTHIDLVPSSAFTITTSEELIKNLEEIRSLGYSYENQELGEGVSAISVPIYSKSGILFGAISVTGISPHIVRNREAIVTDLKRASSSITKDFVL